MKLARASIGLLLFVASLLQAQELTWPQEIVAEDGSVIVLYQPQIEAFSANDLEGRAAISVKLASSGGVPVFGAIWFKGELDTDRDTKRRDSPSFSRSGLVNRTSYFPSMNYSPGLMLIQVLLPDRISNTSPPTLCSPGSQPFS
jgi:hypothetical protein